MSRRVLALVLVAVAALGGGAARATTVTESFDADVWTGVNNRAGGNDFGWSNTSHARGAAPGEIGGTFSVNDGAYYAETDLGATLGLDAAISFSARYVQTSGGTNAVTMFGFFNPSGSDFLGLEFQGYQGQGYIYALANDATTFYRTFTWNGLDTVAFDYTPTGGANGYGTITATVNSSSVSYDLTEADRAVATQLTAFGFKTFFITGTSGTVTQYLDDVTYSYPTPPAPEPGVPEPATAAVLALGAIAALLASGRRG